MPVRLVRPVALAASAVAVTGALVSLVVAPALAERPAQERVQVGKAWQQPVQDAQPSDRTAVPADRGHRMTPEQRLARVRPQRPASVPAATGSGRAAAPAPVPGDGAGR